jgi:hypothetical protein
MLAIRIISTLVLPVWLLAAVASAQPNGRIEITGDYRYATRDSEAFTEAQSLACREAWRLAVMNSPLYQEQTASEVDSPLLWGLAYTLATNHVQDQQIVEQTQRGRTIRCQVHGYLPAEESARVIKMQMAGSPPEGIEQNRALRILSSNDEGGYISIQFQAMKRLDWLSTAYQGSLRESADIMVDFYDVAGRLIRTERHPARHAGSDQSVLNPGMRGLLNVPKPLGAATYRVWLVK